MRGFQRRWDGTVSYTHLDVYKRQDIGDCVSKAQRGEIENEIVDEQTGARGGVSSAEGDEFHSASPDAAVGITVVAESFGVNLDAVAGLFGEEVVAAADAHGIDEVFVEVVDEFDDAVFE